MTDQIDEQQRKSGHSRLVYNKATRTIDTVRDDTPTPGADQAAAKEFAEQAQLWNMTRYAERIAYAVIGNLARAYLAQQQENAELRREKESRAPDRREPCKKCGYWVVRS